MLLLAAAWRLLIGDADVDGGHRLLGFRKVDPDLGVGGCQSRAALQSQISPFFVGGGVTLTPGLHWRQSITFSLLCYSLKRTFAKFEFI